MHRFGGRFSAVLKRLCFFAFFSPRQRAEGSRARHAAAASLSLVACVCVENIIHFTSVRLRQSCRIWASTAERKEINGEQEASSRVSNTMRV